MDYDVEYVDEEYEEEEEPRADQLAEYGDLHPAYDPDNYYKEPNSTSSSDKSSVPEVDEDVEAAIKKSKEYHAQPKTKVLEDAKDIRVLDYAQLLAKLGDLGEATKNMDIKDYVPVDISLDGSEILSGYDRIYFCDPDKLQEKNTPMAVVSYLRDRIARMQSRSELPGDLEISYVRRRCMGAAWADKAPEEVVVGYKALFLAEHEGELYEISLEMEMAEFLRLLTRVLIFPLDKLENITRKTSMG